MSAAGFSDVAIDPVDAISTASDPSVPAIAYCRDTPLRNEIEAGDPSGLERPTHAGTDAIRERFGAGRFSSKIRAFVIVAT